MVALIDGLGADQHTDLSTQLVCSCSGALAMSACRSCCGQQQVLRSQALQPAAAAEPRPPLIAGAAASTTASSCKIASPASFYQVLWAGQLLHAACAVASRCQPALLLPCLLLLLCMLLQALLGHQQAKTNSPELALGTHGILSPHLHAVDCGGGVLLSGQVAAHHLVLMELEDALRNTIV